MELATPSSHQRDDYLHGRRPAWFAFAMTLALMVFDYVDRQVIVSLFPYLKADWGLSDRQLGALASVVSVTVALGALPVALVADRVSRVKSIVAMALLWSLATISCMWARNFAQLLVARALVGVGEAGYGAVGCALIASHFPARRRGALMAAFFAAAPVGSVIGVMLGGLIAARWGWQAAFGVVGLPGLLLALLYLKVRDYPTVPLAEQQRPGAWAAMRSAVQLLTGVPTLLWVGLGAASQLIVVSALWAWLPSFLNREHGMAPAQAGVIAAGVVFCGAIGAVVWGALVDRVGRREPLRRLPVLALLCGLALILLVLAFAVAPKALQLPLIALGGFLATCTIGPVAAIVIEVIHPGVRATGASVLSLCQNLLGLAVGPFLAGWLSDRLGLVQAMTLTPLAGLLAAAFFLLAIRHYARDRQRIASPVAP